MAKPNTRASGAAVRPRGQLWGQQRVEAGERVPEPGWNLHTPAEIGIDDFQASRSPDKRYRTTPLKGIWTLTKHGFYHDGRFATLNDVVQHYNGVLGLGLDDQQVDDLVEYLKSL